MCQTPQVGGLEHHWLELLGWKRVPIAEAMTLAPLRHRAEGIAWSRRGILIVGQELDGEAVPIGSRHLAPSQFVVLVDDPKLDVVVALEVYVVTDPMLRLECFEAEVVQRPGAPAISIDGLRGITVQKYIGEAFDELIGLTYESVDESGQAVGVSEERDPEQWKQATKQHGRRRRPTTWAEKLSEAKAAADVYALGIPLGNPTKAVQEHFGVSRSTAIRLIEFAIDNDVAPQAVANERQAAREKRAPKGDRDG